MGLEIVLIGLDPIVTGFEAIDEFIELRNWYLEFLSVIALIVSEVVNLVRLCKRLWNVPCAIVADKVLDKSGPPVSVHI